MKPRQPVVVLLTMAVTLAISLSTTGSRAASCSSLNNSSMPTNPLAEHATSLNIGSDCNNSQASVSCPGTGTQNIPYIGYGTCTGGTSATFGYTMADNYGTEYSETYAASWSSGSYFWLYTALGGLSSNACGNVYAYDPYAPNNPNYPRYNNSYEWCYGYNAAEEGYFWVTTEYPANQNNEQTADVEDWITDMTTPPDGE